jgi:alanine dehydrogenase
MALLNRSTCCFLLSAPRRGAGTGQATARDRSDRRGIETVEDDAGRLPLLAPMSDIAGRIATQVGTCLLHRPHGGKGLLLGGLPAAERGRVIIIGAGTAGGNAALLAAAIGAQVVVFDVDRDRLAAMRTLGNNVTGLPLRYTLANEVTGRIS